VKLQRGSVQPAGKFLVALFSAVVLISAGYSLFTRPTSLHLNNYNLAKNAADGYALSPLQMNEKFYSTFPALKSYVRGKEVFQPVFTSLTGLEQLEQFTLDKKRATAHLALAKRAFELVLQNSTLDKKQRRWLAYNFDFPLHQDPKNTLKAPWHSAMAQGVAASFATRLYEATHEKRYLTFATQFINCLRTRLSYKDLPTSDLFVTFQDKANYFWLEEYAGNNAPMQVINGHIFAIFGLYDYWKVTQDAEVASLIKEAATTIDHYFPNFRNPGGVSWYGIRVQDNPLAMSKKYHMIVTAQLKVLASITQSESFTKESALLFKDYNQGGTRGFSTLETLIGRK
jgi:hypothetical protein